MFPLCSYLFNPTEAVQLWIPPTTAVGYVTANCLSTMMLQECPLGLEKVSSASDSLKMWMSWWHVCHLPPSSVLTLTQNIPYKYKHCSDESGLQIIALLLPPWTRCWWEAERRPAPEPLRILASAAETAEHPGRWTERKVQTCREKILMRGGNALRRNQTW